MAPMPLTGTIGITSSLKADGEGSGHPFRRSLPEPVVTFHLPTIRRLPSQGDKASRKGKQAIKGIETLRERDDSEDKLSIESSLVLLQSLRQSRLIHLTALLPYLSTRHRTSTKYHPSPPDHPFPGGLDPSVTPHSLLHLGRADVRIGPLVFPKTRFGEVRVEGPVQSSGQSTSKTITATDKGEEVKAPPSAPQAQSTSISKPSAPTSEPPPPIDDAVVKAVSKAAQNDPELQALLHTAANGKANPEELRKLAGVINIISEGLNKSKKKKDIAPSKPAKKSAMSTNSSMAPNASASSATQDTSAHHHVPPPPNDPPSYPPIITIEFRENPSARFILPLWRGCAVEMYRNGEERSIKVTMLLPAIGSTAATRAGPNFNSTPPARKGKGAEIKSEGNKASPTNPPTKEQLTAPAPPGAETHAVTWHISGNRDNPLPHGIWHIFGRVSGTKVIVDGKVVPTRGTDQTDEDFVQQFVNKLKVSRSEMPHTPQLQLAPNSLSREMADHLADKFAPRMQTLVSKPVVKLKRGEADDDEVEVLRDSGKRTRTSGHKPARANGGGGAGEEESRKRYSTAASVGDLHEGDTMMDEEADTPSKPKRKRHVAKFNPDGTLKLCQACGTNTTPMWRRGPAGKSTLCNACGAKWKVGRLVVSSDGLAPVASTLRAQKLEEAFQSHHIIDAEAVTGTDPQTTSKPNQLAAEGLDKVANGTTV